MKKILGAVALFIGISFSNTATAQYFQAPVVNPFGITPGSSIIASIPSLGDLDGDGDIDLIIGNTRENPYYDGRKVSILINDGSGNFTESYFKK